MVELVDETELKPAGMRARIVRHLQRILAVKHDMAGVRFFKQAGDVQQGGFARARGTDHPGNLARIEVKIDAA